MKSIKTKMIVYFVVLMIVISMSLGYLAFIRASQSIIHEAESGLLSTAYEATRYLETEIKFELNA